MCMENCQYGSHNLEKDTFRKRSMNWKLYIKHGQDIWPDMWRDGKQLTIILDDNAQTGSFWKNVAINEKLHAVMLHTNQFYWMK